MGLRELKETAHQQYVRGKFAQCAQTYQQILRLAPRDPNMRVRHAEACRRAGERLQAIASYRAAADLLLELGCGSRARGALKAALELDPNDVLLQADVARLDPVASAAEDYLQERSELPLLPPLESGLDPVPPAAPSTPRTPPMTRRGPGQPPALPPIQRALPAAPSIPPLVPPVLLPAPKASSTPASGSSTKPLAATPRPAGAPQPTLPPRSVTAGFGTPGPRSAAASLPPRSATAGLQAAAGSHGTPPPLPRRSATAGFQAPATPTPATSPRVTPQATRGAPVPPPPPAEALLGAGRGEGPAQEAPHASAPLLTEAPRPRLEVRRLSPNVLAFRGSPTDSWALIRSRTPLEMHLVEDLEKLPPELRDFSLDITVEPEAESAPSVVH